MKDPGRTGSRNVEGLGAILLLIFLMAFPVFYFLNGWGLESEHLGTETEIYALQVSSVINRNPDMWKFETIRLEGLLAKRPGDPHVETLRILDGEGNVVAERSEPLPWPVIRRSHPLMDAGLIVGSLEGTSSVRPLIRQTLVMAVVGAGVILLLLFLFRKYPLTALRSALDMLSREKGRSNVTLQSIGDGVISTDAEGRVLIVNRMAEKITGWTQVEAARKPIGEVFQPEGDVFVDRNGGARRIETVKSPVLDEGGRHIGHVFVFRDVTEKARIEGAMANAQKLESLGVLAGGIAHEIRNPLSSINISISSIERACEASTGFEPESKEKVDDILGQMKSAAAKMGVVVQRVLDYSKPFPPRKQAVDVNQVIEEAVRLSMSTLRKREIALLKDLATDPAICRADAQLIEQVLVNLIMNACQAMEGSGGAKFLEVASSVQDGRVVLRVSDSGPGVPLPLREKVFDPFFTTRKDGSGIGLSFSHRIVTDHGGSLRIETSRWGGAEFRIELPAAGEGVPA